MNSLITCVIIGLTGLVLFEPVSGQSSGRGYWGGAPGAPGAAGYPGAAVYPGNAGYSGYPGASGNWGGYYNPASNYYGYNGYLADYYARYYANYPPIRGSLSISGELSGRNGGGYLQVSARKRKEKTRQYSQGYGYPKTVTNLRDDNYWRGAVSRENTRDGYGVKPVPLPGPYIRID